MPISKNVTPFDVSQVNSVLRAIVAETPAGTRYVNPHGEPAANGAPCYYVDWDGKGSCLVGRVAERLGVPLFNFHDSRNKGGIYDHEYFSGYFTPDALARLQTVQCRQDDGETWRRAIR